jgi:hypothetical protein
MAMNSELESARDDLAYMRGLVSGGGQLPATAGELFMWGGILYGVQCLGHWLNIIGYFPLAPLGYLALGFGPTILFIAVLSWVIWRERKTKTSGVAARALNAAFTGAGLANLVMALVFAYGSNITENLMIWLYHPVVVCMFQGVAWYMAWVIRRRAWLGLVSLGWFATTVACGLLIQNVGYFLLVLGIALLACMALPGYAIMRIARAQA